MVDRQARNDGGELKRTRERALIEGGSEVSREGRRTNVEKKRRKGEIHGRGNPDHVRGPGTPFASYVSRKYALSVSVRRKNRRTRLRSVLASEFSRRNIARSKKTKIKKGRRRPNESRTSKGSRSFRATTRTTLCSECFR